MSVHVEWCVADDACPEVVHHGCLVGACRVMAPFAVVLGPDPLMVIEGTRAQLGELAADLARQVEQLPLRPREVPCPECGACPAVFDGCQDMTWSCGACGRTWEADYQ